MWDKLSMLLKSKLISIYVNSGIKSLDDIKNHYNSFANGGNLNKQESVTTNTFMSNSNKLYDFLLTNYINNSKLDPKLKDRMNFTANAVMEDLPHSFDNATIKKDQNEMSYFNSLFLRLNPYINKSNVDRLIKPNNFETIPDKIAILKSIPLYKDDMDSIKKYMPAFYKDFNLGFAKPFTRNKQKKK